MGPRQRSRPPCLALADGQPWQAVRQEPQRGTGHAVQQAILLLADDGVTLVLSGDVPLTHPDTLAALLAGHARVAPMRWRCSRWIWPIRTAMAVSCATSRGPCVPSSRKRTPAMRSAASPRCTAAFWPHRRSACAWLARLDDRNAQVSST